jgi:hypothetical protein
MADAKKYTSRFTGSEIDAAIRRALGAEYGDTIIPGTRLVGRTSDNPIDLNELTYPGIYTAYFYRHGPRELEKLNGTTPISIMVYNDAEYSAAEAQAQENSNSEVEDTLTLRQTILSLSYAADTSLASSGFDEGSRVVYMFYRDFDALTASGGMAYLDSGAGASGYGWEKLLLSNGNLTVINNLESSSAENVLSANMGRYLKALIDGDDNINFHAKCDNISNTLVLIKSQEIEDLVVLLLCHGLHQKMKNIKMILMHFYFLLINKEFILITKMEKLFVIIKVMDLILEI